MKFFKKGVEANREYQKSVTQQEARYAESRRLRRFWLNPGEEARITFVDGGLVMDKDLGESVLDYAGYYEHLVAIAGEWTPVVCIQGHEGQVCPLCETGDNPSFTAMFTIIDHREWKSKKGDVYKDQLRLYPAKGKSVIDVLKKYAAKREGLAGCTFDVMRPTKKDSRCGSQFDFVEKQELSVLRAKYTKKDEKTGKLVTYFQPADYEEELPYKSEIVLRALGFGIPGVGSTTLPQEVVEAAKNGTGPWADSEDGTEKDYASEM